MSATALLSARLVRLARNSLASARRLIRDAQREPDRRRSSDLLAKARDIIAIARKIYAHSMRALALSGQLTHHYAEWAHGRYRALIRINGGEALWISPRTYGKRQSAQRAAARYVEKLRTAAACAGATA